MIRTKFNATDRVHYVKCESQADFVTCPDCAGTTRVRVVTAVDECEVDCSACEHAIFHGRPRGTVVRRTHTRTVLDLVVAEVKSHHGPGDTYYRLSDGTEVHEKSLHSDRASAEAALKRIEEDWREEQLRQACAVRAKNRQSSVFTRRYLLDKRGHHLEALARIDERLRVTGGAATTTASSPETPQP